MKDFYARDLHNSAEIALFLPYPGTPFLNQPGKHGIEIISFDWSHWDRWNGKPICQLNDFPAQEIAVYHEKATKVINSYALLQSYSQYHQAYKEKFGKSMLFTSIFYE